MKCGKANVELSGKAGSAQLEKSLHCHVIQIVKTIIILNILCFI